MAMAPEVKEKWEEFKRLAKEKNFSRDGIVATALFAGGKHNKGHEYETLVEFLKFLKESKDEEEFLYKATGYLGF